MNNKLISLKLIKLHHVSGKGKVINNIFKCFDIPFMTLWMNFSLSSTKNNTKVASMFASCKIGEQIGKHKQLFKYIKAYFKVERKISKFISKLSEDQRFANINFNKIKLVYYFQKCSSTHESGVLKFDKKDFERFIQSFLDASNKKNLFFSFFEFFNVNSKLDIFSKYIKVIMNFVTLIFIEYDKWIIKTIIKYKQVVNPFNCK